MKTIGGSLQAHMALRVTTLALCWQIQRTDGETFYFTAHDTDLVISGHTYLSIVGFTASSIQTGSTGQVDNLEVLGFLSDDGITVQDLKNGVYDYATIYLFMVNWNDLTMGILRLRRGWLGECVRSPDGAFMAELRGLTQALVQEFGNTYQPICRADLGDSKCKVPIKPQAWAGAHSFAEGEYVQAVTQNTDALLVAIFQAQNTGISGGVEPTWDTTIGNTTSDGAVTWMSKPYWRGVAAVTGLISQHQFVSSALSLPSAAVVVSNTAIIAVRNNISAGTTLTINDGLGSISIQGLVDTAAAQAAALIAARIQSAITATTLQMSISFNSSSNTIILTNNSGATGVISKTGDSLGGLVIQDFASPPLDGGTVTWISGDNEGRSMEMKTYDVGTSTITLWLGMYFPIQVGDRFMYYPGCDKRRDTCTNTYNNILNFRAEPDMPNMDQFLSYPDS